MSYNYFGTKEKEKVNLKTKTKTKSFMKKKPEYIDIEIRCSSEEEMKFFYDNIKVNMEHTNSGRLKENNPPIFYVWAVFKILKRDLYKIEKIKNTHRFRDVVIDTKCSTYKTLLKIKAHEL